jgi:hypothetical protein
VTDLMQQARDIEAALRAEVGKQRDPLRPLFMNSIGRLMNDAANAIAALRAAPGRKLVPVDPTPEMVKAAEEAHMPFGDMELAIQMAIAAVRK